MNFNEIMFEKILPNDAYRLGKQAIVPFTCIIIDFKKNEI